MSSTPSGSLGFGDGKGTHPFTGAGLASSNATTHGTAMSATSSTSATASSLFFTAPSEEASFFSLPYVAELLHCSQWNDHGMWRLHGGPLAAAAAAAAAEAEAAAATAAALENRKISGGNTLEAQAGAHGPDGKGKGHSGSKELVAGGRDRTGSMGSRSRSDSLTTRNKMLQEPAEDYTIEESDLSLFQPAGDLSGPEVHHVLRERISVERFYEEHYAHNSTRLTSQANSITARYVLKKKEEEEQARQRVPSVSPDSPNAGSRQGSPPKSKGAGGAGGAQGGGRDGKGNAAAGKGKDANHNTDDKSASSAPPEMDLSTKLGYNVMVEWQPERGPQLPIRPIQPCTLLRLQTGLARALGLTMPSQDRLEDDLCLGRVRCPRDTLDTPLPALTIHVPHGGVHGGGGSRSTNKARSDAAPPPLQFGHDYYYCSGDVSGGAGVGYYLPMGAHSAGGGGGMSAGVGGLAAANYHSHAAGAAGRSRTDGGPLSSHPSRSPSGQPRHSDHAAPALSAPRVLQTQLSKGSYHSGDVPPPLQAHQGSHRVFRDDDGGEFDGPLFTPTSSTSSFMASGSSTVFAQSSGGGGSVNPLAFLAKSCKQLAAADFDHPEMDAPPPCLNRSTKLFYQCASGDELRQSAILEWFEDVLHYARRNDFTVVQTRAILLIARSLIECLYQFHVTDGCRASWAAEEEADEEQLTAASAAAEEQVETAVTSLLSRLLQSAVCGHPVVGIDRDVHKELVTQQKPDPEALAALEHKMKKEKPSKKQQQQFKEQLEHVPLITTTTIEERVEEKPREIGFAPCFTLEEAATVLEFLSTSALMHWRLICCVLHDDAPPIVTLEKKVFIDSTRRSHIPPLTEFLPANFYTRQESRHAIWREAQASLERAFEEEFLQPMRKTAALEAAERQELVEEKLALDRENREMAFTAEDFDGVESAFRLRLQHQLQANADVGLIAGQERFLAETAAMADIMDEEKLNAAAALLQVSGGGAGGGAGKRRNSKSGGGRAGVPKPPPPTLNKKPASSRGNHHRVPADQMEIPTDAVFMIAEMEERVDTIDNTVREREAALQAGKKKPPPKKGKR